MTLSETLGNWARAKVAAWILRASPENPSTSLSNPDTWLIDWATGGKTAAGISMNEDKALTIGAVYTAVRIISGTIGALPFHVYRRDNEGKRSFAIQHWAYPLLHDSPNDYHTSCIWRELTLAHVLLWGNAYSRIEWLRNGHATALLPLMPWDVTARRTPSGTQVYDVRLPEGGIETLPADEVLHIPGLSYDGLQGVSVVGKMRDSLGLAKVAETFGSSFFANGARPGLVLEVPGKMKSDAQDRLTESVVNKFSGASNAFRAMVLEEGAKLHTVQMPLQDAQFLETRRFQRSEIFGWYGIPPHLGGDTEKQTSWGTGIEQMDIGFAKHTITPWCVRLEQEINRKLFGRGTGLYAKFNLDGLMRGDFKSRMEGYRIAVGAPFLTRNEARSLEDWNTDADPAMDEVITPLNMGVGAKPETVAADPAADIDADSEDDRADRAERMATLAAITRIAERPASAPSINITTPDVRVDNHVAPSPAPAVTVNNQIPEPAAPVVNVDARSTVQVPEQPRPIIEVKNDITVEQKPIDVKVQLPTRQSVSDIARDAKGNIVKVTQTEQDA